MKIIVIGLGNYGSALSKKLVDYGHEVIGVDSNEHKVESVKEKISIAVTLDCTDSTVIKTLPLNEVDIVIVTIGEDIGASLLITALLKKLGVKKLISRAVSPIHYTILEAIGVDEILNPEAESAERFATKINFHNVIDLLNLSQDYSIMEVIVPKNYVGQTVSEVDVRKEYNINIVTVKQDVYFKDHLPKLNEGKIVGVITAGYIFKENDVLIVFGNLNDIRKWVDKSMKEDKAN